MTRLASFSDVHGNLSALEAVRVAIAASAPDAVMVAGDLVSTGLIPLQSSTACASSRPAGRSSCRATPISRSPTSTTRPRFRSSSTSLGHVCGRGRMGPRGARPGAGRLAAASPGRAARPDRRRHARAGLPRLAGLTDCRFRPGTRSDGRHRAGRPHRRAGHRVRPHTCRTCATSAGRSSSTTVRQATCSTATRLPPGRFVDIVDEEVTVEIKRTEFDAPAVANAISARGLPGRLSRGHRAHGSW